VMLHACVITLRNWCFVRARERERETEGEIDGESEGEREGEIERKQRERWRASARGRFGKCSSVKNDAAHMCNNNATK